MVFERRNQEHHKFVPVLNWVTNGRGRMIYGGTKYNAELGKMIRILGIVVELARKGRTIRLPNRTVDPIAADLRKRFPDPNFDDEHIVALVMASRCCVVCTNDHCAMAYLRRADVIPSRPKIFSGHRSHRRLCCDKHIVGVCLDQV